MVSNRRNDDRDYRRKGPARVPKFRILVVCEGAVTEPSYLKAFQHDVKNPRVHVHLPDEGGVPLTVVQTAVRLAEEASATAERQQDDNLRFDATWAVFDVDEHPNLEQAKALALTNNVCLAISNPCFELWALLHFQDQRSHIERGAVRSKVKNKCHDYEKELPFKRLQPGYYDAVARAQSLDNEAQCHGSPGRNPSTNVHVLTELIRTK